jgi:hypothetical protein
MTMTAQETHRLAEIRSQALLWSAMRDTSTWETAFLLRIIDQKEREIRRLRRTE